MRPYQINIDQAQKQAEPVRQKQVLKHEHLEEQKEEDNIPVHDFLVDFFLRIGETLDRKGKQPTYSTFEVSLLVAANEPETCNENCPGYVFQLQKDFTQHLTTKLCDFLVFYSIDLEDFVSPV